MSSVRHSNVISMLSHSYVIRMSLVCHPCVTGMYSYAIRMWLVCTRISSVCHSSVLVCHPYVTRMYSMSSVCTRMSSVCDLYVIRMSLICTRMSSVYHSYVLVCHPYVTRMWFYHEPNHMKTRVNLKYFMTSCSNLICRVEFRRQNSRTRLLNYLK